MLLARGTSTDEGVRLPLSGTTQAEFVRALVRDLYGTEPTLVRSGQGRAAYTLTLSAPSARRYIEALGQTLPDTAHCNGCKGAFLQGVFLACGRVSDPALTYHLEFSCGDRLLAIEAFLHSCRLFPKRITRRGEQLLYFKDSGSLEDFFVLVGLNQAAFGLMDAKIEREFRNNANRVTNCETNNITRAVSASMKQIEVIERLIAEHKLSLLPPELKETALLRLQHRDLSLGQLAALMTPSLTKSGLNHRLYKIMKQAHQLLSEEK